MSAILALILSVLASHGATGTSHATLVACSDRTDVVSVWRDDPTPCDVHKPQRLDVYGLTIPECDDAGGEPIVLTTGENVCEGVDI